MNAKTILETLKSTQFRFEVQRNYVRKAILILETINEQMISNQSFIEVSETRLEVGLIHVDQLANIAMRVDQYEIYIWIDDVGYSMFHISMNDQNSEEFYLDAIKFLETALQGSYCKKNYYDSKGLYKAELLWKNDKYPRKIEIGLIDIFLEKLQLKKTVTEGTVNYSSFI